MEESLSVLLGLLQDSRYYARKIETIITELGVKLPELVLEVAKLNRALDNGDRVNRFKHEGTEYLGLESRRLDYESDAKAGLNPFTKPACGQPDSPKRNHHEED